LARLIDLARRLWEKRGKKDGPSPVTYLPYSQTLLDPPGSHPLAAAVGWLQGTLLGTVATTLAVIAVAAVGMMMLTGRINLRRGASVVFGCFILFGASSVAGGIQSAVAAADFGSAPLPPPYQPAVEAPPPALVAPPPAPAKPPVQNDPFAGASVPNR
jgi:type IV secretory pathway VirB2 component (pilin)